MKVHTKFITFILIFSIICFSSNNKFGFILNLLSEIFFKNDVKIYFILFLSVLNSPSIFLKYFLYFAYNYTTFLY